MKKHITLFEKYSLFGGSRQELWDIDDRKKLYGVSDLSECPEDAIIGRALLSGDEVLDLVKLGMNYSKMGYDEIEYNYLECPEDVELDEFIQDYLDNADANNDKQNKSQYLSSASTNIGEIYTSRVA